jgi:hypothetical protein
MQKEGLEVKLVSGWFCCSRQGNQKVSRVGESESHHNTKGRNLTTFYGKFG